MIQVEKVDEGLFAGVRCERWYGNTNMVWVATGVTDQDVRDGLQFGSNIGGKSVKALRKVKDIIDSLPEGTYITTTPSLAVLKLTGWRKINHDLYVKGDKVDALV